MFTNEERELLILDMMEQAGEEPNMGHWYVKSGQDQQLIMYKALCKLCGHEVKGIKFLE
jgi:hypothetical protein